MASTYSTSLQLQLISNGEQSGVWGTTTNTNWNLIEQAVAGVQAITMSNANYTLSVLNGVSDESRNMVLVVGGSNSAIRQVITPLVPKVYMVSNNTSGGYAITVGGATGTLVTVPNGSSVLVYCDGTNFYAGVSAATGNFTVPGNMAVTGNETIGGTLGVTGNTTLSGTTTLSKDLIASGSSSGTAGQALLSQGVGLPPIWGAAFVSGMIMLWSGSIASIPSGWYLCNGSNGTPNLEDKFIVGAGNSYTVGQTGGTADAIVVAHTHTATSVVTDPGHLHTTNTFLQHTSGPYGVGGGSDWTNGSGTNSTTTGITVATTNQSTGTSGTGQNLPPYYALAYIMKA